MKWEVGENHEWNHEVAWTASDDWLYMDVDMKTWITNNYLVSALGNLKVDDATGNKK